MQKVPFIIRDLSIHKMPGFPRGMEAYRDLAPNINIIAGPNGSGKSSTARIIQDLIWRGRVEGLQAESSVVIGGTPWEIKIDAGRKKVQREGADDEITGIPSPDASRRYMLAMHDLVIANETDLARQIMRESVGGYDLDEAQIKLGYGSAIKNKSATEYRNFSDAEKKYRETEKKQLELKQQEEMLQDLFREREKAEDARKRLDFYGKVEQFLEANLNYARLSDRFGKFPAELAKMTGDEYQQIVNLETEISDCRGEADNAEIIAAGNRERLSLLGLPAGGIDPVVTGELATRVRELERLERDIGEISRKIEEFRVKAAEAIKSIGENPDTTGWDGLRLDDVGNLGRLLQKYHQCLSEKQFYETSYKALSPGNEDGAESDSETIKEGIKILSNWLQEKKSVTGVPKIWVAVLTLAGIASGVLVYLTGLWGLLPVTVAGIIAWMAKPGSGNDLRRKDYEKTGLRQPRDWETEDVAGIMELLISELARAERDEQAAQSMELCRDRLAEAEQRLGQVNKQREQMLERLKSIPGIPREDLKSYDGLYWFLVHAAHWQKYNAEFLALTGGRDEATRQKNENLGKFNDLAARHNAAAVRDAAGANAVLNKLIDDITVWKDCRSAIERQNDIIREKKKQMERAAARLREIYEKIGIEQGHKERVRELALRLEEFGGVRNDRFAAEITLSDRKKIMESHSLFKENGNIQTLTPDEVPGMIAAFAEQAEKRDRIKEEITRIETNISNVRQCHDLEEALSEKGRASEGLEDLFERNLASVTGQLLVDHLRKESREQNRPKVFKRANVLFNRITQGRYELILDEKAEPSFRAYDTVQRLGQELDELSTGTRIQLLMSLRLAFIETQESALMLPVLADELLANSDDTRAGAIIEALVEISRDGRQVFYFTAQGDEVARWQSFLKTRTGVSSKIIELAGRDNESSVLNHALQSFGSIDLTRNIPLPDGAGRRAYKKILAVPPFNLMEDPASRLHLWYLVDDNQLLYNCLKRGITYWGQLESFLVAGRLEGFDAALTGKLEKKVRLLDRFCELYRKGRSRQVDREIIKRSGAVSANHIDGVTEKLTLLGNDPEKLIQALRNREVYRFKELKTDELEQYLIAGGFINRQEPLPPGDFLLQINAYLSTLDLDPSEGDAFLKGISDSLLPGSVKSGAL
jgi:hypothetical protein